ncbi:unnamed protein product [Rotaria magnacalcarata]|uniref:BRICHOS domain-containing protein n=1 Tax=Rotaria magnacalcarata TaxID=392030 RepID=A0A816ZCX3_9BILA|nr:unnamed protein product [Rotaria magnacalcarata]CAF2204799.1 unnamed protein product [Rotaria magnacalcarata]CAF3938678.1 unnamed protein product [Rotaria magnacalcarata]CAF4269909.1 unnamed protein product [Rotaria magnacalcarata]
MLRKFHCFLFTSAVLLTFGASHYDLDIVENGLLVKQKVNEYDDLQIFEVPQHANRLHIIAYLDHRSGLQMIKDIKNQKCQLSNMEQPTRSQSGNIVDSSFSEVRMSLPQLPLLADQMHELHIMKLEMPDPLQNVSYLRSELREACTGLPIYWADSIDESQLDGLTRNGELLYDHSQKVIQRPLNSGIRIGRQDSCNKDPNSPPSQSQCHANCIHQKCRVTSDSCYYFITCPMNGQIGTTCVTHNLHMNGQCKMCCNDPGSPCTPGGFFMRCACLNW